MFISFMRTNFFSFELNFVFVEQKIFESLVLYRQKQDGRQSFQKILEIPDGADLRFLVFVFVRKSKHETACRQLEISD